MDAHVDSALCSRAATRVGSVSDVLLAAAARQACDIAESGVAHVPSDIAAVRELYASGRADEALDAATALVSGMAHPSRAPARADPMERVPVLAKSPAELSDAPLDHRDGFILALIDGASTIRDILDASAMPEEEGLAHIERLHALGIIDIS